MSSLFSSPGKQAQQAASVDQTSVNSEIKTLEDYVTAQQAKERDAISGMPLNPYNDVAFGNLGPGLKFGQGSVTPGPAAPNFPKSPPPAPPPAPPPPQSPPPPPGPPQGGPGRQGGPGNPYLPQLKR